MKEVKMDNGSTLLFSGGDGETYDSVAEKRIYKDAERYRRLRENWIDCDELDLHGRLAAIDAHLDKVLFHCEVWQSQMGSMCKVQCPECKQAEADG